MKNFIKYFILSLIGGIYAVSLITSERFTDIFIIPKQFYFIFSILISAVFIFGTTLFSAKSKILNFNFIDLFFVLYILYTIINYFTSRSKTVNQEVIILILMSYIYFLVKIFFSTYKHIRITKLFMLIIISYGLVQATIGILQFAGIIKSINHNFRVIGTLGNPGPLTNYLVSVLPISLGVILFFKRRNILDKALNFISIIAFIATVLIIILSGVRTAWIASFIGTVVLLNYKYSFLRRINQKLQSTFLKVCLIAISFIIIYVTGYKLYSIKTDSSLGRLFIWETTIEIIKENPFFGTGYKTFLVEHNKKQAAYFINNPDDIKRGYLADNITNAFNDYLEITAELGFVGLILFLALILSALFSQSKPIEEEYTISVIIKLSLFLILITCFFSYTLTLIPVYLNFVVYLALISSYSTKKSYKITLSGLVIKPVAIIGFFFSLYFLRIEYVRYKSHLKWKKADWYVQVNKENYALKEYEEVYPVLNYSGNFLYNYGTSLSLLGYYNKSLKILKETETKLNSADFYLYLGNTYEGLNLFNKAEQAFRYANKLIPHKLYPEYRLVLLYKKTGKIDKAVQLAKEIIQKQPKVKSGIVDQIKTEMEDFVKEYDQ